MPHTTKFRVNAATVLAVGIGAAVLCMSALTAPAMAQGGGGVGGGGGGGAGPDFGINFVTVGAPGNSGYDREDPFGRTTGRGSVPYEFRIGRTEITTAQYVDFVNTYLGRPQPFLVNPPTIWGADRDLSYTGPGFRFRVLPGQANLPVLGISWRDAARFCNWLHNDRQPTIEAISRGAYDTSTFGRNAEGDYTDQARRSDGARFWIPSLDEWLKAAHYDPNKNGAARGGWWLSSNGSDVQPIPGPPPAFGGTGQTSAGLAADVGLGIFYRRLPVGSYPSTLSPWGLLDTSGSGSEWIEEVYGGGDRGLRGSSALVSSSVENDLPYSVVAADPTLFGSFTTIRIASAIPGPGSGVLAFAAFILAPRRRRTPQRSA